MQTAGRGFWKWVGFLPCIRQVQDSGTTAGVTERQEWSGELGQQQAVLAKDGRQIRVRQARQRVDRSGKGNRERDGRTGKVWQQIIIQEQVVEYRSQAEDNIARRTGSSPVTSF